MTWLKSLPRITVWQYEVYQVMPNSDLRNRFLNYYHPYLTFMIDSFSCMYKFEFRHLKCSLQSLMYNSLHIVKNLNIYKYTSFAQKAQETYHIKCVLGNIIVGIFVVLQNWWRKTLGRPSVLEGRPLPGHMPSPGIQPLWQ